MPSFAEWTFVLGIFFFYEVNIKFTSVCFCSGCCCGAADVEAPTEQNLSVRVSQAKDPKEALSSQKSHPVSVVDQS